MTHPERRIQWSEPVLPEHRDAAVYAEAKRRLGMVPGLVRAVTPLPWLSELVIRLIEMPHAYASYELLSQAALVATQENACRHCYGAQRAVMRLSGYTDAEITRLAEERELGELDPERRKILRFARQLARSNPRPAPGELRKLVDAGFDEPTLTEVAFFVAAACNDNRVGTFLAVPPDERLEALPDSLFGRVFRFVLRRRVRRRPRSPIQPPRGGAPFPTIVGALGDSPTAAVLADSLRDAFASSVLPRRAKALVFAVVAHGLGCDHCEDRSRSVLEAEGLGPSELDEILVNLGSAELDEVEQHLVRYARETIRYQPVAIQQRTRELASAIGEQRTLEAVGIAALANAVVRLGILASW